MNTNTAGDAVLHVSSLGLNEHGSALDIMYIDIYRSSNSRLDMIQTQSKLDKTPVSSWNCKYIIQSVILSPHVSWSTTAAWGSLRFQCCCRMSSRACLHAKYMSMTFSNSNVIWKHDACTHNHTSLPLSIAASPFLHLTSFICFVGLPLKDKKSLCCQLYSFGSLFPSLLPIAVNCESQSLENKNESKGPHLQRPDYSLSLRSRTFTTRSWAGLLTHLTDPFVNWSTWAEVSQIS